MKKQYKNQPMHNHIHHDLFYKLQGFVVLTKIDFKVCFPSIED